MTKTTLSSIAAGVLVLLALETGSGLGHDHDKQCIEGLYHKASPSPETKDFQTCHAWKNSSCCTAEFTVELMANQTRNLYNHSWHRCGNLSQQCEAFWVKQECFYQCSPDVYKWKDPSIKGALKGVPVCSYFCDAWFDACKTDKICVEDVLADYNSSVHGENFCPNNKNCTSYVDMYGSGKGLCEKMWGQSYIYTKPNAIFSNCLMMDPNGNVNQATTSVPTVESKGVTNSNAELALFILPAIVLTLLQ